MFILSVCNRLYAQENSDSIRVYFRQGRTEIDMSLRGNREALGQAAAKLADDSSRFIRSVTIVGGASPEGSVAINRRLSEQRAQRMFDYLSSYRAIPDSLRHTVFFGRDWGALLRLAEASDKVPHKAEVVALIRDIIGNVVRNEEDTEENLIGLKRLHGGVPYEWLYKNLFPELRGSSLYICYDRMASSAKPDSLMGLSGDIMPVLSIDSFPIGLPVPGTLPMMLPVASGKGMYKPFYMSFKTNLLYDALLVPNIGIEFYLGRNWSVAGNWAYAWWKNDHRHNYWRIYGGDAGLRYWFGRKAKGKPLTGHHLGTYGQFFTYDFEIGGRGYMGDKPRGTLWDKMNYAAGVEYGYSHPIARRLNVDFTAGIGYWGGIYHEYLPQDGHYVWQMTKQRGWFGPTKAEISLVWLVGRGNVNRKGGAR